MAIKFFLGFDTFATVTELDKVLARFGGSFSTTAGRFGGGAYSSAGSNTGILYNVPYVNNYHAIGAAIRVPTQSFIFQTLICAMDVQNAASSNMHGGVFLNSDGSLKLMGDSGTEVATSAPGIIQVDTDYYIEFIFNSAASGTGQIWVNGTKVVEGVGDFQESTAAFWIYWGASSNGSSGAYAVYDDIYYAEDAATLPTPLGDARVQAILANADTATADWVPLAGAGYTNIDDALFTDGDGDTSYISATTLNAKSEFDMESLPISTSQIHAISTIVRASKTDAGVIAYTAHVDSAGVEAAGAQVGPSETAYGIAIDFHLTDPNTAAAWTEAAVNAVKLGVEITG